MNTSRRFLLTALLALAAAPAAAQAPAEPAAEAAAAATRPVRQSWTSDRRAFVEGDIITVVVDEYALATAHKGNSALDSRRRDLTVDASADAQIGGARVGPLPAGGGAAVGTSNRGESRQRGDATRENQFRGEITVRVLSIEPNGLMKVEGKKLVNVDKNRQEITLTGLIRPQDVSSQNLVESWRVADAQLVYSSKGSLGKPSSGILSRLLGALWP